MKVADVLKAKKNGKRDEKEKNGVKDEHDKKAKKTSKADFWSKFKK
jgi:hypothetical protein